MRKIKNREMATDWHSDQNTKSENAKVLEEQIDLLHYASTKRKTGYPSVHAIRRVGLNQSALILSKAYALIDEAYSMALVEAKTLE